jgi:arabinose-5-phosphate isomerase
MTFDFVASALRTIQLEQDAVAGLNRQIDANFTKACELILACKGRVVVSGVGKSGHIARKIAATLASTGTPAMFVHPAEASHGDMGMITRDDLLLAISYSGGSHELLNLLPLFKRLDIPLIAMTGNHQSILAENANAHLSIKVDTEACPLNLAPTSSTTATVVLGDALAIALLEARGFTAEDFAFSHPGGTLGRKLLLKLKDIMHTGDAIPIVTPDTPVLKALMIMSEKGFGMTTIQANNQLLGIYTDGDLRRSLDKGIDIQQALVSDLMNTRPKTLSENTLAAEALKVMEQSKINVILVTDKHQQLAGIVKINDILRAGVI